MLFRSEENKKLFDEYALLESEIKNNKKYSKEEREQEIDRLRSQYAPSYEWLLTKDFAGLTALADIKEKEGVDINKKEKGYFTAVANNIVSSFEKSYDTENLWKKINKATKNTLKKSYESGLMSLDAYYKVSNMFENYLPLRDFSRSEERRVGKEC